MAHKSQFALLQEKRFLPLFLTQFFGAFNDNVFKNALVMLITYVVAEKSGVNTQLLITFAAGLFILPIKILCVAVVCTVALEQGR